MNPQLDLNIELLWYWEGPIERYYTPVHHWRSSRELACWYLRKGSAELMWKNESRTVQAGNWIIPPPLRRNEYFSADAEVQSIRFKAFSPDRRMLLCPAAPIVTPYDKHPHLARHLRDLRAILKHELKQDIGHKLFLDKVDITSRTLISLRASMAHFVGALMDIAIEDGAPQAESKHHPAITAALDYMAHRNLSTPLREDLLENICGVSITHLRRLFRAQIGMTIMEWNSQHLESSVKQALRSGAYTCKEIAHAHGFCSSSHFSRWFRNLHNCTPKQFEITGTTSTI